jgi:polyhydroxyalkanoate synthesis regulator protein
MNEPMKIKSQRILITLFVVSVIVRMGNRFDVIDSSTNEDIHIHEIVIRITYLQFYFGLN